MGSFNRLPVELLIMIFGSLGSIDDSLHLARSCRAMYRIFNVPRHRLAIFKSIICTSPQHKHDLQLCLLQGVFQALPFKPRFTQHSRDMPSSQTWRVILKDLSEGSDFTDSMVWEIVVRWHAMKLLWGLYCDPPIRESYMRSAVLDESHGICKVLASEDSMPGPSSSCSVKNQTGTKQLGKAYVRFYQALTAHWVATETYSIARGVVYETSDEYLECFGYVWDLRVDNPGRTLAEKLDVLEVVDFVSGYLGRKVFQGEDSTSDWIEGPDYSDWVGEDSPDTWLNFYLHTTQFLRPPHIIELSLLLTWAGPQACGIKSKPDYLRQLGSTLEAAEVRFRESNAASPETFIPVHVVDEDVVNSLDQHCEKATLDDVQHMWQRYREGGWNFQAKGKIYFDELSPVQWVERIETA